MNKPASMRGAGDGSSLFRPPPLRTSNTYDDEDIFNNVSLNLLSRYDALGLSAAETIQATIISQQERISFHEALCIRRSRSVHHVSPSTALLVERVDKTFGCELMRMIREENGGKEIQTWGKCHFSADGPPTTPPAGSEVVEKKARRRRFFPDSDSKGGGFFRSRKVKNIDWSLAEAVSQVQSLRLDGSPSTPKGAGAYQPPSPVGQVV